MSLGLENDIIPLLQVAKTFYNTKVQVELMSEEETLDMTHVVMRLHFDNQGFRLPKQDTEKVPSQIITTVPKRK